jgi:hypothetical protein
VVNDFHLLSGNKCRLEVVTTGPGFRPAGGLMNNRVGRGDRHRLGVPRNYPVRFRSTCQQTWTRSVRPTSWTSGFSRATAQARTMTADLRPLPAARAVCRRPVPEPCSVRATSTGVWRPQLSEWSQGPKPDAAYPIPRAQVDLPTTCSRNAPTLMRLGTRLAAVAVVGQSRCAMSH